MDLLLASLFVLVAVTGRWQNGLFAVILVAMPFLPGCRCPVVDSGHRGIVFKSLGGGTSKEVLGEGLHLMPLWNSVITYDTRVHEMKEVLVVISSNGLTMQVDTSVRYRPKADELFERRRARWIHVPYKGTAEQMLAVTSGQVMVGVNSNGFAPYVDSGKLRLLATFGAHRTQRWPQVPTLKELGHGIVAQSPYGLVGPRGLPREVVQTLHDAFRVAMNDPAHVAELALYDQVLDYLGPEDYGRALRTAFEAERRTVERLGLAQSPP